VIASTRLDLSDHELKRAFAELGFVTVSGAVISLLRKASRAASVSDVTILLEGETGTGKQVLARAIHQLDQKRSPFRFVTAHCSTISEALAESELFGHHRGAFTGAIADRPGLFQAAHCGTLFLDDVNDLPLCVQPKLLDVIQRGVLRPVGTDREMPVNVRIIAACNQPLEPLVRQQRFRSDLFHRLNVIRLHLPPLRERRGDLEELILAFATSYKSLYEPIVAVEKDLVAMLQTHANAVRKDRGEFSRRSGLARAVRRNAPGRAARPGWRGGGKGLGGDSRARPAVCRRNPSARETGHRESASTGRGDPAGNRESIADQRTNPLPQNALAPVEPARRRLLKDSFSPSAITFILTEFLAVGRAHSRILNGPR
jgi:hypothetical protein